MGFVVGELGHVHCGNNLCVFDRIDEMRVSHCVVSSATEAFSVSHYDFATAIDEQCRGAKK
jgi:hypothetical protein